jgi:hypothetical protein
VLAGLVTIVIVVVPGDPWYAFMAAAGLTIIPVYLTGGRVTEVILAVTSIGSVLVPVFRHRLQATPPRAVQDFLDRISPNPFRRARPEAVRPALVGPETVAPETDSPAALVAPRPPRPAASRSLLVENPDHQVRRRGRDQRR